MASTTEVDRVQANTDEEVNARIEERMRERVRQSAAAGRDEIERRIRKLEWEWDIERYLETLAPSLSLTGIALASRGDRRWLLVPTVVLSFLLQHAVQGWCPPVPVFRRMGVRTRQEIDRER